jgi:hypothetical protein
MRTLLALAACLSCAACVTPAPFDYSLYRAHEPRSLLVLPPLDDSMEVDASYAYLATVTEPLAERGFYVFPVAVVDRMLRDNGLPTPGEMQTVPLERLDEIFGADAVLYITLKDWGTAYEIIDSTTRVSVEARLVDVKTGTEIWRGENSAVLSSSAGQNSIFGALIGAVVNQISTSVSDPSADVARECNDGLFCNARSGLLHGPRSPDHGKD